LYVRGSRRGASGIKVFGGLWSGAVAELLESAKRGLMPAGLLSWIWLPKRGEMPTPCGGRCLKTKPGVGLEIEGDDGISAIGL
jgi:hypothetical protein